MKPNEFAGHGKARLITAACVKPYNTDRPHNAQQELPPRQCGTKIAHLFLLLIGANF